MPKTFKDVHVHIQVVPQWDLSEMLYSANRNGILIHVRDSTLQQQLYLEEHFFLTSNADVTRSNSKNFFLDSLNSWHLASYSMMYCEYSFRNAPFVTKISAKRGSLSLKNSDTLQLIDQIRTASTDQFSILALTSRSSSWLNAWISGRTLRIWLRMATGTTGARITFDDWPTTLRKSYNDSCPV